MKISLRYYYAAVIALVSAVIAVAFCCNVKTAGLVLAASLGVGAMARLLLPETFVPAVRNRTFDVIALFVMSATVAYLSLWGNTPQL